MFEWFSSPEAWIALGTLTALEIVLGIDNIIFISILVGRLPVHQRNFARTTGLALAMLTRLGLLFSIAWVVGLTEPWFTVLGEAISGRDIILIGGGLFLLAKATFEIHNSLEGETEHTQAGGAVAGMGAVLFQIAVLDIIFSLDSVITAVGLASHVSIMAIAIVLSVAVMLFAAKPIGDFVDEHPDHQDPRPVVPDHGGCDPDGGGLRRARAEGLYLFRHGVLGRRRNAQPAHAQAPGRAGAAAQEA